MVEVSYHHSNLSTKLRLFNCCCERVCTWQDKSKTGKEVTASIGPQKLVISNTLPSVLPFLRTAPFIWLSWISITFLCSHSWVHRSLSSGFENTTTPQNPVKCGFDIAYLDRTINRLQPVKRFTYSQQLFPSLYSFLTSNLVFEYKFLRMEQLYLLQLIRRANNSLYYVFVDNSSACDRERHSSRQYIALRMRVVSRWCESRRVHERNSISYAIQI